MRRLQWRAKAVSECPHGEAFDTCPEYDTLIVVYEKDLEACRK